MLQRKILADTIRLNTSGLAVQGLNMLQSILLIRFLDPETLGHWLAALLVLSYATYASLGLEHGMALRLPYYRGRTDPERSVVASDSAYVVWTLLAILCGVGVAAVALVGDHDARARHALLGIALVIPLTQQHAFFSRWQTSVPVDFSVGARILVLQGIASFALVVPAAYAFGLNGVIVATVIVNAAITALWMRRSAYRYHRRMSRAALRELFHAGIPMLLVVIGGVLIQTVDRVVIISSLGAASLGYYAVTGLGGNALYGFFSQAGSAMSPHIVEESGRGGGAQLAKYLVRPTLIFAYASAALLLIVAAAVPMLVRAFVPKYIPGLPAFYAFIPGFFFLAVILTASNIFVLLMIERGTARMPVYLQAVAIAIEASAALAAVRLGWGLLGVALASTTAYAVYGLTTLVVTARLVLPAPERWKLLMGALVPLAIACAGGAFVFSATATALPQSPILRGVADLVGAGAVGAVLAALGVRRLGLIGELRPLVDWARARVSPADNRA
jgi:O-antigen/teichoic acid export membrane protein